MGHLRILLAAGVGLRLWLPAIVLVISSMLVLLPPAGDYRHAPTASSRKGAEAVASGLSLPLGVGLTLSLLTLLLVWLGVCPTPFLDVIRAALAQFV